MHTICIDAWNQAGYHETTFTVRANGSEGERNDGTLKVAIINSSIAFEPGILKRESNGSRMSRELSTTLRSQMGDNQTAVLSYSAKPGEMIRMDECPHLTKEISHTLTRSDGKLGDNQPTVIAFAQNTRDEVRKVNGDGKIAGALAAEAGMHQTNYLMSSSKSKCFTQNSCEEVRFLNGDGNIAGALTSESGSHKTNRILSTPNSNSNENDNSNMKAEVRRLTPTEVQRLQGFDEGHLDVNNQGDSAKYSETGNSWAVPNARFVLKGIHKVDEKLTGKKRSFKYGTISSGVEAHTQASAGFGDQAVFFSEIAPAPCGVLATHYPNVPNLGDMTRVDYDANKKCIHNAKYDGYELMDEKILGFKPLDAEFKEIPCEFGDVDIVSGGTPCFTAGNMVLTESGYRPIEEIKVGDIVISHLGRPCRVAKTGNKKASNIIEVKIGSRPAFCVTDNHPFVMAEMYRDNHRKSPTYANTLLRAPEFRAIGTATANSCAQVFTPSEYYKGFIPHLPSVYNADAEDIMELAGWYVGDGYIRNWKGTKKRAVILCLNSEKLSIFKERYEGRINYTPCKGRTAWKVQICCTALANWLSKEFGELALNKTVPAWLIGSSGMLKDAFVRGYLTTDGHSSETDWSYTTISKSLAYGLADLLGEARVYHTKSRPTCVIEGRVCNCHDQYEIKKSYGISNKFHRIDGKTFVKVRTIEPVDADDVYNLEVEGDHTYICNGFCVHNCTDLSVAGKRKGAEEGSNTRSALAFQLPRIASAVGAKYEVWENVAGAFSSNGGKDFTWLLHRMTEYGYKALAWRCMDAQFIRTDKHPRGVPQRRRRVWIVGYKGTDWRVPCEALFEPMKVLGDEPPKRTVGVGYLKKIDTDAVEPQKTELEEFQDFIAGANPKIIDILVNKGVCESVASRLKELKDASRKNADADMGMDLFGGDLFGDAAGSEAEKHQGRGLKAKDLELNCPDNADIRKIPQVQLFQWAKTVCSEIGYFGEMFKAHDGTASVDDLQPQMLENIGNAGFLCDGFICTMKVPEWNAGVTEEELADMPKELAELYDGDVCGLSDVLEPNPDPKYKLSWRACYGILRRAVNRGKKLPIELGYALVERIIEQAPFVKWMAMHGKDTVKKEGDISERQIAKTAFDDYISGELLWDQVSEREQDKSAEDIVQEESDDAEGGDDGDGESEEQ